MNNEEINSIIEQASKRKSDDDYNLLFDRVKGQELFFNLLNENDSNNNNLQVPMVSVGENLKAVVFFVSKNDKRLSDKYAGIVWERGLEMVLKMPNAKGIVIQSSSDAWVAVSRKIIEKLLNP